MVGNVVECDVATDFHMENHFIGFMLHDLIEYHIIACF